MQNKNNNKNRIIVRLKSPITRNNKTNVQIRRKINEITNTTYAK